VVMGVRAAPEFFTAARSAPRLRAGLFLKVST
jgi:hypothetical protein